MNKNLSNQFKIIVILFLLLSSFLFSEVPKIISFQGKLYDSTGDPLTGTQSITFKIYNVESGGSALWTESHSSVNINDGIFNIK